MIDTSADAGIPGVLKRLGIPGLADIHVHFLPEPMLLKVWDYFDRATENYGRDWPVAYRLPEAERLDVLRGFGLRAIPALTYPHKPGMARWLNDWSAGFAAAHADVVPCATFFPEESAGADVARALAAGARLFKAHVQVGRYDPGHPLLRPVWEQIEAAGVPVVIHAGSAPLPGRFTGVEPVRRVLRDHPDLCLVIAHMGMSEYHAFADLAEEYRNVHLDTTMFATDFTEHVSPMPADYPRRLPGLAAKIVLGTDFPNIPYPYFHQLEALGRLGLGDDWMRAVLWDNGARLLGLPAPGGSPALDS